MKNKLIKHLIKLLAFKKTYFLSGTFMDNKDNRKFFHCYVTVYKKPSAFPLNHQEIVEMLEKHFATADLKANTLIILYWKKVKNRHYDTSKIIN